MKAENFYEQYLSLNSFFDDTANKYILQIYLVFSICMGNRHGKVEDTTMYSPSKQNVPHKRREKPKRISKNSARKSHGESYSAMPNPLFSYTSTCSHVDNEF